MIPLHDANVASHGQKAATLAVLLREGFRVPEGFVVSAEHNHEKSLTSAKEFRAAIACELEKLGNPMVAVRSSATNEDTAAASAAGQYESVIGVWGPDAVCEASAACWSSADTTRVSAYWNRLGDDNAPPETRMPVLVQRVVEAEVSGVMFTSQEPRESTRIEASWGLGLGVVSGAVTPDVFEVHPDGPIKQVIGSKRRRIDLDPDHGGLVTSSVDAELRRRQTLDHDVVTELAHLGERIATALGEPQDIEWALANGEVWILQSRPITKVLPALSAREFAPRLGELAGTPASGGTITGVARIVRGYSDFANVQPGDILICPYTDPTWTPLFAIAGGVVTETGGTLSHGAIVAREYEIPAVTGVNEALIHIKNGQVIALDGALGTITLH